MSISKSTNTKAVRRIELTLQKLAADILYFCQLQETGSREKSLNIAFLNCKSRAIKRIQTC